MITQSDIQIPVMEQFLTLQGEGRFTGHTAYRRETKMKYKFKTETN